jgi:1A family penicillin-binding protein
LPPASPAGDPDQPGWTARLLRARARLAAVAGRAGVGATALARRVGPAARGVARAVRRLRVSGPVRAIGRATWRRKTAIALVLLVLTVTPVALLAAWSWQTVSSLSLERIQEASFLYGAGQALSAGLSVEAVDLAGTLRRLRYQEVAAAPRAAGQFHRTPGAWEIFLNARSDPRAERAALRVRLPLDGSRIVTVVNAADGSSLDSIELEPEILSGLSDTVGQFRRPIRLSQVPKHLMAAVLAAEDHRFFEHGGVDAKAVLRAIWVNLRRGEVAQGGSTLTQQLVKNLVLTPRRTWGRKVREAGAAVMLEWRYGKNEILETYLNAIYLGQHGSMSLYGVGAAARSYFGKDVEKLTLGEAALLAGMIRAPNTYSPVQNADRARERRDLVLTRMRDLGLIDEVTRAQASEERIRVRPGTAPRLLGPYFLDYVRAQIEPSLFDTGWQGGGLRVYTTLDPVLQRAAEAAVSRGLDRLEGRYKQLRRAEGGSRLQAALIALDPVTGEVRALVGGRDYTQTQFNRAVLAHRQPGSAFKPFVYLAALGYGPNGTPPPLTPVSVVNDEPLSLRVGRDTWTPRNYEDRFEGPVTVRRALEQSLNAATVRVAEAVGYEAVIRIARYVGFTSPMQPVPALALGSFEVTPLELATAYATLANGGQRLTPITVRAAVERDGTLLDQPAATRTSTVHPGEAFLVTNLLRGVVDRGTGAAARSLGVEGPVAGKTGTTNDGRDAWFVGYTPRLVTLVWVGFDEREVLRLSGSQAALPIWADFTRAAAAVFPPAAFTVPTSVVFRDVDPTNGKLATRYCPTIFREAFLSGTEPRELCNDHGGAGQLFDSLFQRFLDALGKPKDTR